MTFHFKFTYAHIWQHFLYMYSFVNNRPDDGLQRPKNVGETSQNSKQLLVTHAISWVKGLHENKNSRFYEAWGWHRKYIPKCRTIPTIFRLVITQTSYNNAKHVTDVDHPIKLPPFVTPVNAKLFLESHKELVLNFPWTAPNPLPVSMPYIIT